MTQPGSVTATLAATVAAVLLFATGCSTDSGKESGGTASPSPTSSAQAALACAAISTGLVTSVQAYIDTYGTPVSGKTASPTPSASPSSSPSAGNTEGGLQAQLAKAQADLKKKGCDLNQFRSRFSAGVQGVRARGPVAQAVLLRLTASLSGTLGSTAVTRTLKPRQDIEQTAAHLGPGSTIRLAAGHFRLPRTLVLLAGITLQGAGRDRTLVTSRAGGSGVLVLTDGKVALRDLTLKHVGKADASVLLGGPTSMIVLASVRITGGRGGVTRQTSGGSGVTMSARPGARPGPDTTLQVTGSDLSGNAAAGILLSGGHRASIRTSRFAHDRQCGVCFAGSSTGAVRRSTFHADPVGVAVLNDARPLVRDSTFTGGLVGIQVSGRAEPVIRDVRIGGATRAAMIFGDSSSGKISGAVCTHVPYGIVVSPKAVPLLGKNSCTLARGR